LELPQLSILRVFKMVESNPKMIPLKSSSLGLDPIWAATKNQSQLFLLDKAIAKVTAKTTIKLLLDKLLLLSKRTQNLPKSMSMSLMKNLKKKRLALISLRTLTRLTKIKMPFRT